MTVEELIAEGRRLQRRTVLLTPEGAGKPAAVWYGHNYDEEARDGHRCWLSVNSVFIPSFERRGWLSILTDDTSCEGGRVDVSSAPWKSEGVTLYAKEIEVLPPIDAVIARGSPAVGRWLEANRWQRDWRYNSNFRDKDIVEKYEAIEQREYPLYWQAAKLAGLRVAGPDAYASLGGWHTGWPDDDWHDLLDAKLLVHTYLDSEPWVEAWELPSGEMKVIQRIT